ncbi:ATP-binding protein [Bosea minatitlanensis]|uniref:histidine kinase n=1 Tax=Bosea minatitlanensis TaxID=128782 RepID=A0ABW0F1I4_9HYPH|nr:ATP-binding protein [Bosea minatitlanensis]MCT4492009.1 ATP-binding protein [Bosea minatitlanensis]
MRRFLRLPGRIGSQIALLVVCIIAVLHLILGVTLFLQAPRERPGPPILETMSTIVRVIARTAPEQRPDVIASANAADARFRFGLDGQGRPEAAEGTFRPEDDAFARRLGPGFSVALREAPAPGSPPRRFLIGLPDGAALNAEIAAGEAEMLPPRPVSILLVATVILIGLNVGALSLWASRGITAPLARFAAAAEEFSIDRDPSPLREEGPEEVRTAARALNRLRDRIHAMFADRTRMLAAVGHDLRTPITRMRLRVEFIEDEALRAQFTRDLEHMDAMVQGALSYLRDANHSEQHAAFDLSSLLQTVADEFADMGHDIRYEGPRQVVAIGHPQQFERALTNLAENAVRYGREAVIRLRREDGATVIEVADDGPGIPEADRQRLLEPFMRGDDARGRVDSEGFGLGLSIAQAVVAGHRGSLTLTQNQPRGLLVRITLPQPEG